MGYGNAIKLILLLDILLAIHIRPEGRSFLPYFSLLGFDLTSIVLVPLMF